MIGDYAQIGINVVIYPGVSIGCESVVGSNSYVISDIPSEMLSIGVPAKVIGKSKSHFSDLISTVRLGEIMIDFGELLKAKGYKTILQSKNEIIIELDSKKYGLRLDNFHMHHEGDIEFVNFSAEKNNDSTPTSDIQFQLRDKNILNWRSTPWSETIREYMRKRGLKFSPKPWRYCGGLI
jgi:hypothetical protein